MNIYVPCPDVRHPIGGVKAIYRYVDLLNECGFSAFVLHHRPNFKATWFEHNTRIAYIKFGSLLNFYQSKIYQKLEYIYNIPNPIKEIHLIGATSNKVGKDDYMLVPAIIANPFVKLSRGTKKIIFNQNTYQLAFKGYTIEKPPTYIPYHDKDVIAVLTVSEDNRNYLQSIFSDLKIFRHHLSINTELFAYEPNKRRQICFMPRKNKQHVLQVINILKLRNALSDFKFVSIENKSEKEVASILKESLIFLSFGYPEGFGLPPAEAMACGCIVIGYHGCGGKEYFKEEFCYPINFGDIIEFAKTVETVVHIYMNNPHILKKKAERAAAFIQANYAYRAEQSDIINLWTTVVDCSQTISE